MARYQKSTRSYSDLSVTAETKQKHLGLVHTNTHLERVQFQTETNQKGYMVCNTLLQQETIEQGGNTTRNRK